MKSMYSFLTIVLFMVGSQASALSTPKIEFDNNNIYVRVAMSKQRVASRMQELSGITVDLMQDKIVNMLTTGDMPFTLDIDTVNQIRDTSEEMKSFITVADAYNDVSDGAEERDNNIQELIPTAFIATVGLKASVSLGIGGGGNVTVGIVVMPITEYVIPRRPEQSDEDLESLSEEALKQLIKEHTVERWTVSWAFVGWPNVDLGVGAGATPGAVKFGAGLIWGPLKSAKDFHGLVAGVSVGATLAVGVSVKTGVVHNSSMPGYAQMKYILVGGELGVAAEVAARVNVSVIFTEEQVLRMFFSGETKLSGEQVIEEYRRDQAQKARERGEEPVDFFRED